MTRGTWNAYIIYTSTGRLHEVVHRLHPILFRIADHGMPFNFNTYGGDDPHLSVRTGVPFKPLGGKLTSLENEGVVRSWETQPYHAPKQQRRAYELASRLYLHLQRCLADHVTDVTLNDDVQFDMFHGLRELLADEDAIDEALFWNTLTSIKRRQARQDDDLPDPEEEEEEDDD